MDMLNEEEEVLTIDSLVLASQDLEPYIIEWPLEEVDGGHRELWCIAVMKRQDGVLLAIPKGSLGEEELALGNQGDLNTVVGYSTEVELPTVVLDGGALHPTGASVMVVLVDFSVEVLQMMRVPAVFADLDYSFDPEDPVALPEPGALVEAATSWIQSCLEGPLAYYTAESSAREGEVAEANSSPVRRTRQKSPKEPKAKAVQRQRSIGERQPDEPRKQKRPTTASLATSMEQILEALPVLTGQVQDLVLKQKKMEQHMLEQSSASFHALAQPLSQSVRGMSLGPSVLANQLQTPPRTGAVKSRGILPAPLNSQPTDLAMLEEEKPLSQPHPGGDHLAQAVLAQSQALTTLVSQIAQTSADPLSDLSGTFGTGTRGTSGRMKLQSELASRQGLFFASVMRSMARRMHPTGSLEGSPAQLMERGVCGTKYMERFGGYGKHRDLGTIQFQVMTILDYLQMEDWQAARDSTALLAVCMEQAVMDNGKFDLAALLCLQDDLPANIYLNRNAGALSRSKSFSPLADQKWITTALAFLKEMDTIVAKRGELGGSSSKEKSSPPVPKAKLTPKKKGKGRGQQNQNHVEELEEA